ncbi:MAG: cobalamin-dependent protein, partial [bacterium]|nr:cobalamin-dependent protein [bacterium]
MKVILTRPCYKSHIITPPLGLGYLSAFLKSKNVDCQIIDGLKLNLDNAEIVSMCQDTSVVGITVLSSYFLQAIDLSQKLKKAGKIVVIGGPHATSLPLLTLQKTNADFVILGEGEKSFYQLI